MIVTNNQVIDYFTQLFGDGHFVLCNGKRAINNILYPAAYAKTHADNGGQIGLWIPTGFIAVDVDDVEQAEILSKITPTLKCKTKNGMHFYYKVKTEQKQRVKAHTPIGLVVDTRVAEKGYCVIPVNDTNRSVIEGDIQELPFWLEPLNIQSKAPQYIIPNAGEGSGRNDSMVKHVMRLKSFFDEDQLRMIVNIINEKVFSSPLPADEIDGIFRSCSKYQPVERDGQNQFLLYNDKGAVTGVNHIAMVEHLIKEYRMFVLGKDELYYYQGGVFVNDGIFIRDIILKLIDNPRYQKQAEVAAIYKLLLDRPELVISDDVTNYEKRKINFLNGMFDVDSQMLLPHSADYLSTIQIPYNYIANNLEIEDIQLFDFLRRTQLKTDDISMLLQFLAYCLLPTNHLKVFMVLVGQSNTGKSTLINIISKILGHKNVSNLSIHEVSERFYPSELKDKLLNANADNESFALKSIANIKKITGNDRIMWERKGQNPYFFTPLTRLMFSFNTLPLQVEEKSDAFYQRIRILEMNRKVIITQNYYEDLVSDNSILAIIPVLCRICKTLTVVPSSDNSKLLTARLRSDSDSVTAFMYSKLEITLDNKDFMTKDQLFMDYIQFCVISGLEKATKRDLYTLLEAQGLREVRRGENKAYGYAGVKYKIIE